MRLGSALQRRTGPLEPLGVTLNAKGLYLRQETFCIISANMNVAQCKMARAGLGLTAGDLAAASGVSLRSVMRFESGGAMKPDTIEALARALVSAGAAFVDMSGKVGVLVKP